jgi:hypothetical protein
MKRFVAIVAACAVLVIASGHAAAAGTISGTWKITPNDEAGSVQLDLRTSGVAGHHDDESGNTVTLSSLGLTPAQLAGTSGRVSFTIGREAGNIVCTGTLGDGWGAGRFTFTPSAAYAQAMASRGSAPSSDMQQMGGTMLDITTAYVDGLAKAGFGRVPYGQLFALRALNVTPEYVADMKAAGVTFATPNEAVEARALRVDAGFVREMAGVGYPNLRVRQLVELRALRIDAAFVRKAEAHGFHNLSIEKLVQAKAMNVIE